MKKLWILAVVAGSFAACNETAAPDNQITTDVVNNPASASTADMEKAAAESPAMKFEEEAIDFGTITQGEKVKQTFHFTNTGKSDLLISSARGSCGCTVPDWPKTPIAPGEKGTIEVLFNSDGKLGRQHKKIFIIANTNPADNVVAISGDVIGPAE